jgi:hypothetical protein
MFSDGTWMCESCLKGEKVKVGKKEIIEKNTPYSNILDKFNLNNYSRETKILGILVAIIWFVLDAKSFVGVVTGLFFLWLFFVGLASIRRNKQKKETLPEDMGVLTKLLGIRRDRNIEPGRTGCEKVIAPLSGKDLNFLYRFDIPKSKSKKITKEILYNEILSEMAGLSWGATLKSLEYGITYKIRRMQGSFTCVTRLEDAEDGVIARTVGDYAINVATAMTLCGGCGLGGWFVATKVQDERLKTPRDQITDVFNNVSMKLGLK